MRGRHALLALATSLVLASAGCGTPAGSSDYAFDTPAPEHSRLPNFALDTRARPVMSWVEPHGHAHRLVYAVLGESGWEEPVVVAQGADWFVNWADVPSVQPMGDELWAAHWLVKRPGGTYAYDVALSLSRDAGRSWSEPFWPHRDGTPTEHGFVSLWPVRLPDGRAAVGAAWLDGRHTLVEPADAEPADPRMALRHAVFEASGAEVSSGVIDERVCDCCATDVALTPQGALVAYRDRDEGEIRDIHVASSTTDGWRDLGAVAADGWRINGCPVNGPAIAARNDQVAVAWYTQAAPGPRVQLARRGTAEAHWSPPVVVDADEPLGRVDLVLLEDGDAAVSWMSAAAHGRAWILLARVGRDGISGRPLRIAASDASRPAGFPRLIRDNDALLVAWTRWQRGVPRVVTARVEAADLPAPG